MRESLALVKYVGKPKKFGNLQFFKFIETTGQILRICQLKLQSSTLRIHRTMSIHHVILGHLRIHHDFLHRRPLFLNNTAIPSIHHDVLQFRHRGQPRKNRRRQSNRTNQRRIDYGYGVSSRGSIEIVSSRPRITTSARPSSRKGVRGYDRSVPALVNLLSFIAE